MSSRRVLAAGVVVGLLAPVVLMSPASAVERPSADVAAAAASAKSKGKALTASVAPAVAGERVTFTAKRPKTKKFRALKTKKQRKARLLLQRLDGKKWRSVARTKLGAKKKVRFTSAVPKKAKSAVRYRVRAVVGKKQYAAGSLRLKVVTQQLAVVPSGSDAEADVTYASRLTPVRAGRAVVLERYDDGEWSQVARADMRSAAVNLAASAADYPYPAWYRVSAAAHRGIPATQSKPVRTSLQRAVSEVAHRAGASLAPEQTLGALEVALAAGAPSMEIDVQLTSDRVPVIVHDQTFARTTDVAAVFPGREDDPVGSFTWAEVQQLDAGSWFGAKWAGEPIPSLDEWLTQLAGRAHLVLEVKFHPNNAGTPQQVADMRAVLDEHLATGLLGDLTDAGKLTVSSFNHGFLQPFAEAHPEVPVGVLTVVGPSAAEATAWSAWAEEVHSMGFFTSRVTTDAVRAAGLTTSVWTLKTADDYRAALVAGAERFITDVPGTLQQMLNPPAPAS